MNRTEQWNLVLKQLQENAVQNYRSTQEYELRQKREEDLDDLLSNEFLSDQKEFIDEVLLETSAFHDNDADRLYRQGMKDCVWLLKNLEVLA